MTGCENKKYKLQIKYGPKAIGQVIRILNKSSLIIDVGKDTLSEGDRVQVYEYHGPLKDLTGYQLGTLEVIKSELTVIRCEPGYSICETDTQLNIDMNMAKTPLLENLQLYRHKEMNVHEEDIDPLELNDPVIHIGDPVKLA